jgi:hypothetical protein
MRGNNIDSKQMTSNSFLNSQKRHSSKSTRLSNYKRQYTCIFLPMSSFT